MLNASDFFCTTILKNVNCELLIALVQLHQGLNLNPPHYIEHLSCIVASRLSNENTRKINWKTQDK